MKVSDAPLGTKMMFGTFEDNDLVWFKVSDKNDFLLESSCIQGQFDYPERMSDSRARRAHGNNFFPQSNIWQWLNSSGKSWWHPTHDFDTDPYYSYRPGFMSGFTPDELHQIVEREIAVAVPLGSRKQFGRVYQMKCAVCLPAASEINDEYYDTAIEGEYLPEIRRWFAQRRFGVAQLMTRTGVADGGHILGFFNDHGENMQCKERLCVRPMIRISGDTVLSDSTDTDGVRFLPQHNTAFLNGFWDVLNV